MRSILRMAAIAAMLAQPWSTQSIAEASVLPTQSDDWFPSQIQPTDHPLNWSRATLSDNVTLDELGRRPLPDTRQVIFLLGCERAIQLDCVESVGIVTSSGAYRPATWVSSQTVDVDRGGGMAVHATMWQLPGIKVKRREVLLAVSGIMGGQTDMNAPGLMTDTWMQGISTIPTRPEGPRGCVRRTPRGCFRTADFPPGTTLRFVIRTSWLAPSEVQTWGANSTFVAQDLGGGAHRYVITGSPSMQQSSFDDGGTPAWVTSAFRFRLVDPRTVSSDVGTTCAVNRPATFGGNISEPEALKWNAGEGKAYLVLRSSPYWADGKTPWQIVHEERIPEAVARCMWGVDPQQTERLRLRVYSETTGTGMGTASITFSAGEVVIRARTLPLPQAVIEIQVLVHDGEPCLTAGVRVGELLCTQGPESLAWALSTGG